MQPRIALSLSQGAITFMFLSATRRFCIGGLRVWPEPSRGKQHQPNNWIIEWPNETACAAVRINRLHHSPLGIHCYPSLLFHLPISLLPSFPFPHSFCFLSLPLFFSQALTICHFVFLLLSVLIFLSLCLAVSLSRCLSLPFSFTFVFLPLPCFFLHSSTLCSTSAVPALLSFFLFLSFHLSLPTWRGSSLLFSIFSLLPSRDWQTNISSQY